MCFNFCQNKLIENSKIANMTHRGEAALRKHKRGKCKKISKQAKQSEIRKRLKRHLEQLFCKAWE